MGEHPGRNPARFLSLTIIDRSALHVRQALAAILDSWSLDFAVSEQPLALDPIYSIAPPPGGAHLYRLVLYSPRIRPDLSVIVTNLADGWNSLSHQLARETCALAIQLTSTQHDAIHAKQSFQLWRNGKEVRLVMVLQDDPRWTFFARGDLEAFEEPELYTRRRIADRLDRDALIRYCARLGWNLGSDGFWQSDRSAVYFEQMRKLTVANVN
jgi:hypothetical protein